MDTMQHGTVPTDTADALQALRLIDPAEAPAVAEKLARLLEGELDPPPASGPGGGDAP